MKKIIAKKSNYVYIEIIALTCIIVYSIFKYITGIVNNENSIISSELIFLIFIFILDIYSIYMVTSKPKNLIIKENENFIIYPNSNYQIIIPISEVVSASRESINPKSKSILTLNTKYRGYQIIGVLKIRDVVCTINDIVNQYNRLENTTTYETNMQEEISKNIID